MIYEHTIVKTEKQKIMVNRCPFCGSDNIKPIYIHGEYGYNPCLAYVKCKNCRAAGPTIEDNENVDIREAIKLWNTRR